MGDNGMQKKKNNKTTAKKAKSQALTTFYKINRIKACTC